jgi:hypothetical protein
LVSAIFGFPLFWLLPEVYNMMALPTLFYPAASMTTMRRKPTLILMMALIAIPLATSAQQTRRRSTSTNIDGYGPVTTCGDIHVTFDRRAALTEEARMTLTPGQVSVLRAQASNNGIYVTGWDRAEYEVRTCKAVPDDDPNAADTLRQITTANSGGTISVNGPSGREFLANLIIMVPRLSSMDLKTANGPLQLRDLAGVIHASAANGPISLQNVGGSVEATTSNGPISVKGSSGDHHLTATNGPIHIDLAGGRWEGPGLEASTQNGPLSIAIPDNYGSGIRIQASDHSPVTCKSSVCSQAVRTLTSPSIIRFGSGDPVVRLSTVNGPLSIQGVNN